MRRRQRQSIDAPDGSARRFALARRRGAVGGVRKARHWLGRDGPRELLASAALHVCASKHVWCGASARRTVAATECIPRWCRSACGTPGLRRRGSTEAATTPRERGPGVTKSQGRARANLRWRIGLCIPAAEHDGSFVVGTKAAARGCVRAREAETNAATDSTYLAASSGARKLPR